jgi:hypothetical protein
MKLYIFCFLLLSAAWGFAEGTQTWEQSKFDEFEKGTTHGIAIRSEGTLELAPEFKPLYTSPSTYLWAITTDSAGNVYAAAGSPAQVYRITPDGKAQVIFEPKELQIQALAEHDGVLYAATSPDGKVYSIQLTAPSEPRDEKKKNAASRKAVASQSEKKADAKGEDAASAETKDSSDKPAAKLFFDPQTKYIWDLAVDKSGNVYVATGDNGQIFRVNKSGEGSVFFKSDEAHIRVLAFDRQGNLLAGSDGSGLIYRISPTGDAFVLYSASKKEITALAVDEENNIYAAGIGEKRAPSPAPVPGAAPLVNQPVVTGTTITVTAAGPAPGAVTPPLNLASSTGGSEIYKIASDGAPTELWSSRDELVYALAFERIAGKQRLIAGTGNKGRIFAIRDHGDYTDLVKASANQVTAMANGTNGALYAATSNLGKVFVLGPSLNGEGDYESDVFDAHLFSQWGRMEARGEGNFELLARSGNVDNPDRNWSPWERVNFSSPEGPMLKAPPARFVQWKAVLHGSQRTPELESVTLNYRSKNVAPVIDEVAVQVGARFPPSLKSGGENTAIIVGADNSQPKPRMESFAPAATRDKNSIAVRWSAHDDNNDDLVYSLLYRGEGESEWRPLTKDRITDKFYSFDADLLPDGAYIIKVIASDAPSHSPEDALAADKESSRFEVDNTPPRIEDLNAAAMQDSGGQIHVTFRAADSFSPIRRAEYSFDAGDWQFIEPVGKISDSKTENYDFNIPLPANSAAGEHVVVVRAYDQFDNVGSAKVIVKK